MDRHRRCVLWLMTLDVTSGIDALIQSVRESSGYVNNYNMYSLSDQVLKIYTTDLMLR